MGNNPVRFNDPTGHKACGDGEEWECGSGKKQNPEKDPYKPPKLKKDIGGNISDWTPPVSGNNLEFNIIAGIPLETQDHGTVFLFYLSLGMVTDYNGNVQLYYTTLDQVYTPGSNGETGGFSSKTGGDSLYGLGVGTTRGIIWGEEFSTDKFLGKGYTDSFGALPITVGLFGPQDKSLNYKGFEYGPGAGFSMGEVFIDTKRPFNIPKIPLPPSLIPGCQSLGQCGSGFLPVSQ